jgi:hypothetical protein
MKVKEKSQLIKWLALSLLLGAAARFLEALANTSHPSVSVTHLADLTFG